MKAERLKKSFFCLKSISTKQTKSQAKNSSSTYIVRSAQKKRRKRKKLLVEVVLL